MEEGLSRYQELIIGVASYPALGSPRVVRIDGRNYWSGGVWLSKTQIIYTQPYEDVNDANDDAKLIVNRIKGKKS